MDKVTEGLGQLINCTFQLRIYKLFVDLHLTTLKMGKGFALIMKQPMCFKEWIIKLVNVMDISPEQMELLPRQIIQKNTQTKLTASISSRILLPMLLCWQLWPWILKVTSLVALIIWRSGMEFQKSHLFLANFVGMRYQLQSNLAITKCGWSEYKIFTANWCSHKISFD